MYLLILAYYSWIIIHIPCSMVGSEWEHPLLFAAGTVLPALP